MATIAIFDLDHTLIAGDSSMLWTEYLWETQKITDPTLLEIDQKMMADYQAGTLDMSAYITDSIQAISHISIDKINHWIDDFIEVKIKPLIYPAATQTINFYREHGVPMMIISATSSFIVKKIAQTLNINLAFGIDIAEQDNHYIGEIIGIPTFREGKVDRLKNWFGIRQFLPERIIFYTDSINDLPMCEYATDVLTVNADKRLQQKAVEHNWTQLHWQI